LTRPGLKFRPARLASEAAEGERSASAFQEIAKYVVKKIESQASPAKVLRHILESG